MDGTVLVQPPCYQQSTVRHGRIGQRLNINDIYRRDYQYFRKYRLGFAINQFFQCSNVIVAQKRTLNLGGKRYGQTGCKYRHTTSPLKQYYRRLQQWFEWSR